MYAIQQRAAGDDLMVVFLSRAYRDLGDQTFRRLINCPGAVSELQKYLDSTRN